MARKPGSSPSAIKSRAAKSAAAMQTPAVAGGAPAPAEAAPRRRTTPSQFFKEVRAEARKITWTTRKETWITSVMVLIMVAITAIFLKLVDLGLGFSINQILKLATGG